jgi:hypothetical protein
MVDPRSSLPRIPTCWNSTRSTAGVHLVVPWLSHRLHSPHPQRFSISISCSLCLLLSNCSLPFIHTDQIEVTTIDQVTAFTTNLRHHLTNISTPHLTHLTMFNCFSTSSRSDSSDTLPPRPTRQPTMTSSDHLFRTNHYCSTSNTDTPEASVNPRPTASTRPFTTQRGECSSTPRRRPEPTPVPAPATPPARDSGYYSSSSSVVGPPASPSPVETGHETHDVAVCSCCKGKGRDVDPPPSSSTSSSSGASGSDTSSRSFSFPSPPPRKRLYDAAEISAAMISPDHLQTERASASASLRSFRRQWVAVTKAALDARIERGEEAEWECAVVGEGGGCDEMLKERGRGLLGGTEIVKKRKKGEDRGKGKGKGKEALERMRGVWEDGVWGWGK